MSLIVTRPGVRSGKLTFVGTRITVYDVLEYLASRMTPDQIVGDFPELTGDHVRAELEFAVNREHRAHCLDHGMTRFAKTATVSS